MTEKSNVSRFETEGYAVWKIDVLGVRAERPEFAGFSALTVAAAIAKNGGDVSAAVSELSSGFPSPEEQIESVDYGPESKNMKRSIEEGLGRLLIYGDYDADGTCATALAKKIFSKYADSVSFFIPDRYEDGYGLHSKIISKMKNSFDSLVVVDCGVNSGKISEDLDRSGKKVFVFDHHESDGSPLFRNAIDPKAFGENIPGSELCAAALLWTWAVRNGLLNREEALGCSWLAALATIADCMPLTPLNRSIVEQGLSVMSENPLPEAERLMKRSGIGKSCATGRIASADIAVRALSGEEGFEAAVDELIELNERRKEMSRKTVAEVLERFEREEGVLEGDWPAGVLSGAASSVCASSGKPTVLASVVRGSNGKRKIRGTVRVPEGGDAAGTLSLLAKSLSSWGGHKAAAGFSCAPSKWESVKKRLKKAFSLFDVVPEPKNAFEIDPKFLTANSWLETERILGPFGHGNTAPAAYLRAEPSASVSDLGKTGEHYKIENGKTSILAFFQNDSARLLETDGWICELGVRCWRGREELQSILVVPANDPERKIKNPPDTMKDKIRECEPELPF